MHGEYCNCEDCWWARGQREVCPTCGCLVEEGGCPCAATTTSDATSSQVLRERSQP